MFDPFFTVRETLRIQSGYFGVPRQRRLDRRAARQPRPRRQGRRQHAPALRRHEAARAGRAGAGAPAAGDRARRADRRRRRRAAPDAVAVRRAPQPRRPHGAADDALPRGSRGAVRPHRDAEARPRRRARPHLGAARRHREHDAALQARPAAAAGAARRSARVTGRIVQLTAHDAREVESHARPCCARPACELEDLEIGRADLEDVFLEIMQRRDAARGGRAGPPDARRAQPPAVSAAVLARQTSSAMPCSPAPARCSTRRCCASGR